MKMTEPLQRCNYLLVFLAMSLVLTSVVFGQGNPETSTEAKTTRINLYYHLGSVEIPTTFSGEVKANWTDAWAGFLRSEDGSFEIGWRAGTIVLVREKRKDEIESIRTELVGDTVYDVVVLSGEKGKTISAKTGWLEFSSLVETTEKEDLFWSVLSTYQKARCKTCRSLPIKIDN